MNTTDNNKLIAEFMGVDIISLEQFLVGVQSTIGRIKIGRKDYICPMVEGYLLEHLQYHKSWDWLMPVVERILDISFQDEGDAEDFYSIRDCMPDINHTYKAVVEFIEWYNSDQAVVEFIKNFKS